MAQEGKDESDKQWARFKEGFKTPQAIITIASKLMVSGYQLRTILIITQMTLSESLLCLITFQTMGCNNRTNYAEQAIAVPAYGYIISFVALLNLCILSCSQVNAEAEPAPKEESREYFITYAYFSLGAIEICRDVWFLGLFVNRLDLDVVILTIADMMNSTVLLLAAVQTFEPESNNLKLESKEELSTDVDLEIQALNKAARDGLKGEKKREGAGGNPRKGEGRVLSPSAESDDEYEYAGSDRHEAGLSDTAKQTCVDVYCAWPLLFMDESELAELNQDQEHRRTILVSKGCTLLFMTPAIVVFLGSLFIFLPHLTLLIVLGGCQGVYEGCK